MRWRTCPVLQAFFCAINAHGLSLSYKLAYFLTKDHYSGGPKTITLSEKGGWYRCVKQMHIS